MKVKFCPKCKSVDVSINIDISAAYGAPQKYKCNKCGFELYNFPEMKKEIKKSKIKARKNENNIFR